MQLYTIIQQNKVVKLYYASILGMNEIVPSDYYHVHSMEILELVSGPAVMYNKIIIVATKTYETIPWSEHLIVVRL